MMLYQYYNIFKNCVIFHRQDVLLLSLHIFNRIYFYIDHETSYSWSHKGETKLLWTLHVILGHVTKQFEILGMSGVLLARMSNFLAFIFTISSAGNKKTLQILMADEWDNAVCLQCTQRHSSFRNFRFRLSYLVAFVILIHCYSLEKIV